MRRTFAPGSGSAVLESRESSEMRISLRAVVLASISGALALVHGCKVDFHVDPNFDAPSGSAGDSNNPNGGDDSGGDSGGAGNSTGDGGAGNSSTTGANGGDSSGSGGSGVSVPLPVCGDGDGVCTDPAPADWSGPVAMAFAGPTGAPSCAGSGYESQVFAMHGDIDEGAAVCDCTCGDPSGQTCTGVVNVDVGSSMTVCNVLPSTDYFATEGNCTAHSVGTDTSYHAVGAPTWSSVGGCPAAPTEEIDEPQWGTTALACEASTLDESCDDDQECLPALGGSLDTLCIYRDGENACPDGPYSEQHLLYADFDDNRDCTACSCDDPEGQCNGYITYSNGCDGSSLWIGEIAFGTCVVLGYDSWYDTASDATPDGGCDPIGGELDGEVDLSGAITACCLP
jgi:hypothetical protein